MPSLLQLVSLLVSRRLAYRVVSLQLAGLVVFLLGLVCQVVLLQLAGMVVLSH